MTVIAVEAMAHSTPERIVSPATDCELSRLLSITSIIISNFSTCLAQLCTNILDLGE